MVRAIHGEETKILKSSKKLKLLTMKKTLMLILTGAFGFCLLLSCGGKGDTKESEWVMNAKLDSLITNMAACEQQNSNCPAYLKAEEGIKAMAKDTSFKNLVEELFNGIKYSNSGARSAACAHALTFWVYDYEIYKKPEYGRIVLDALKKEKFDEKLYYGSTLGQLLSGWLATDDEGLLKDLHAAVADKNVEMRGRRELIRLSGEMSFAKAGYVDLLIGIANDATEELDIRLAVLGVLWRVSDPAHIEKVEAMYMTYLNSEDRDLCCAAMVGISYMRSVAHYAEVLAKIEELGANEDYISSCSVSLSNYIGWEPKEGIDNKKALNMAVKFANDKNIRPFYRSYYLSPIEYYGGPEAITILTKLGNDKEKDIAEPAKKAVERLKKK